MLRETKELEDQIAALSRNSPQIASIVASIILAIVLSLVVINI